MGNTRCFHIWFKSRVADVRCMRLAEALKLRADLNTRILELGGRLNSNAKVQEGESPAEDPEDLLAELDAVSDQMQDLITRINLTNSVTRADDGRTLTELIARRDILIRKSEILRAFLNEAGSLVNRYSSTEIRVQSTVNVRDLRKVVDSVAEEARSIDVRIQELNWTTDLV